MGVVPRGVVGINIVEGEDGLDATTYLSVVLWVDLSHDVGWIERDF